MGEYNKGGGLVAFLSAQISRFKLINSKNKLFVPFLFHCLSEINGPWDIPRIKNHT